MSDKPHWDFEPADPQRKLEHRPEDTCWCLPRIEVYEHGRVVIHNDPKMKGAQGG